MLLVCYMEGRRGQIFNGGWYTVISADHSKFFLKGESGTEFEITARDAMAKLWLMDALTYACIQGLTLKDKRVRLCDADHPRFCWHRMNVGLSRATSSDLVEVA